MKLFSKLFMNSDKLFLNLLIASENSQAGK